jgi:hypothetical protein
MGYICSYCGEGLPEDETCPCQSFADDEDDGPEARSLISGPLTTEVADVRSPVRQFLTAQRLTRAQSGPRPTGCCGFWSTRRLILIWPLLVQRFPPRRASGYRGLPSVTSLTRLA